MRLALHLSTYNGSEFLPGLFASLDAQTDQDWVLRIRDDGSNAEELAKTRTIIGVHAERRRIDFVGGVNIGFAASHQDMYAAHDEELVLLVNQDVICTPAYIATVRRYMEEHSDVAAAAGTILRWNWDANHVSRLTNIIDSIGLAKARSHKVYDIASGVSLEDCTAQYVPVFGISGCLPMYRRSVLGATLFDTMYFMYKEDVDVAYRIQELGFRSVRVPGTIAYHFRGFQQSILHRGVSSRFQELSYRNHLRNLRKHLSLRDWLRDGWAIVPFECAKACFFLLTNPMILWRTWHQIFLKRV
jgi:GT2 family glycosyltransferase